MKMQLIAVRDLAAQAFMQPSFVHATGVAVREFGDVVNNPEQPISRHPDDYEMYFLGEFDDSDGSFTCPNKPALLARGVDLVTVKN